MSEEEIRAYVETGDPLDKAGAYGIQGPFARFVEKIEGDYYTVVGLPVAAVYRHLKRFL
jgi:septum formation protein